MSRARLMACCVGFLLAAVPHAARAQMIEVAPLGGYRFGGDLYEYFTGTALDIDGAPSFGAMVEVFIDGGTSVSLLYSRQQTRVELTGLSNAGVESPTFSIDHWHLGGTQELRGGRVRPVLSGSLGLTRFGYSQDSEVRFSLAGGGGVKLMPSRHFGARLDGRLYAVFVDGDAGGSICAPGVCLIGVDVSVIWQAEFTAGLVVAF